jgi:hypothetical protein
VLVHQVGQAFPPASFGAPSKFSQLLSGVVEGLNGKAKVTMRKSYLLRTYRVLELVLYHSLGRLPERSQPTIFSDESKKKDANSSA